MYNKDTYMKTTACGALGRYTHEDLYVKIICKDTYCSYVCKVYCTHVCKGTHVSKDTNLVTYHHQWKLQP